MSSLFDFEYAHIDVCFFSQTIRILDLGNMEINRCRYRKSCIILYFDSLLIYAALKVLNVSDSITINTGSQS